MARRKRLVSALSDVFGRAQLRANYKQCKRCGARYPLLRVGDGYICMRCAKMKRW